MTGASNMPQRAKATPDVRSAAARALVVGLATLIAFGAVSGQLVRLALKDQSLQRAAPAMPLRQIYSRPDIVDRGGRLLASDVGIPTVFADPSRVQSIDETLERLAEVIPGIDNPRNRRSLTNTTRKYHLLKRAISPARAQAIHDMGLPGIHFEWEPKRSYPGDRLAGHILGHVNGRNHGKAGIERFLNANDGVERVHSARVNASPALRLSIDVRAQYGLEQELAVAMDRHNAEAATGIVIDVETGEIHAAASLPGVDPSVPSEILDKARMNRFSDDVYELGSVFKVVTIAMALDYGIVSSAARINVAEPLKIGRYTISDDHRSKPVLSVSEVFTHSSNIGAGVLAQVTGAKRQREFLNRIGLTKALARPDVRTVAPKLPKYWGEAETVTIGYGHGMAVSPLQFAVALAGIVNGGYKITPTFLAIRDQAVAPRRAILKPATSRAVRRMMRDNVRHGTGKLADVPGYRVGGKTGTADLPRDGQYDGQAVIASFAAAFPMDQPRFVVLVTLFDPRPEGGEKQRTAAKTAAPVAGSVVKRLAPLLGVRPRR